MLHHLYNTPIFTTNALRLVSNVGQLNDFSAILTANIALPYCYLA